MRTAIWWLMDYGCAATGHRLWCCYNTAPRPVQRLWYWSLRLEAVEFEPDA